jgi:predicted chitinase
MKEIRTPKQIKRTVQRENSVTNRDALLNAAKEEGIEGIELAALMGQAEHESDGFQTLIEHGEGKGKSYSGGGETYYGRGVFQLTHDYNYKKYGNHPEIRQYLNKNYGEDFKLEDHPNAVAIDPELSAKVAIAYWKEEVRPAVEKHANGDFGDTQVISAAINRPAGNTLDPNRSVKKTNKAYEDFDKNKSLESLVAIEDAHHQSMQNRVKGTEDRFNKTRKWAERLGLDPSKVFDKPIIEKDKFQEKIKLPPVPPVPPASTPAPPSSVPTEQTGASLSPEEEPGFLDTAKRYASKAYDTVSDTLFPSAEASPMPMNSEEEIPEFKMPETEEEIPEFKMPDTEPKKEEVFAPPRKETSKLKAGILGGL